MGFYVLGLSGEWDCGTSPNSQARSRWSAAWVVDRINGDSEKCPVCGRHASILAWVEPRKMRLVGKRYPDRLVDNLLQPLVVSQRFVEMYRKEGLTGVTEFAPIQVVNPTANTPNYFLGHISFDRSIQVDLSHTAIEGHSYDWSCPLCNPWGSTRDKIHKLALHTENWSGHDIMRLYAPSGHTIVSQRFYDCVRQYGLTNFVMTPVEKYQFGC